MSSFLEQYGTAIFTLVLVAILVAFASPMGKMIKTAINTQIENIDDITTEEVKDVSGQNLKTTKNSDTAYEKQIPDKTQSVSVNKIGGKTIVWNQLAGNIPNKYARGITISMKKGYVTFKGTIDANGELVSSSVCKVQNNEKIAFITTNKRFGIQFFEYNSTGNTTYYGNGIYTVTGSDKNAFIQIKNTGIGENIDEDGYVNIFNLTQMFGAGNEPSTVEEFEAMFPNDYYPYNEGELMNMPVNEVVEKYADKEITHEIPQKIFDLPGYGWSAGDVYNEVDFENKQYIQRVGKTVFDGSEEITYQQRLEKYYWYSITLPNAKNTKMIVTADYTSSDFPTFGGIKFNGVLEDRSGSYRKYDSLYFSAPVGVDPIEYVKGKTIYYELAEPIVTDISDIIPDGFLENINVKPGGTLIFKNSNGFGYKIPVPNEESFVISLKGNKTA